MESPSRHTLSCQCPAIASPVANTSRVVARWIAKKPIESLCRERWITPCPHCYFCRLAKIRHAFRACHKATKSSHDFARTPLCSAQVVHVPCQCMRTVSACIMAVHAMFKHPLLSPP